MDQKIKKYNQEKQFTIANELIKKKIKLLTQELNNRKERNEQLDREIARAIKPRKQGGLYESDRKKLQNYQANVRNVITKLELEIQEIRNE